MTTRSESTYYLHKLKDFAKLYTKVEQQPTVTDLFAKEQKRLQNMQLCCDDVLLDISRQNITSEILNTLCNFAKTTDIPRRITKWMDGDIVNHSENRCALHHAYRHAKPLSDVPNHTRITWAQAHRQANIMRQWASDFQKGNIKGEDGKALTTIINIGIGGSHLGMEAILHALHPWRVQHVRCKFLANIDPHALERILEDVDIHRCAIVFSSKSATTLETTSNFMRLIQAMKHAGITHPYRQCFAVTSMPEVAQSLGIARERIFTIDQSIGGRYSLWSPVGFVLHCCIQPSAMNDFFAGGRAMDIHTRSTPIAKNIPILLALVSFWRHSLCGVQQHAFLAYSHALRTMVSHLQQLIMESNGKRVTQQGAIAHTSGEVVWGGENSNGQHSYFQLLHQGNIAHNCDVWMFANSSKGNDQAQQELNAMALGQMQALAHGNTDNHPERVTIGKVPLSVLFFSQYTAKNIGSLLALYENRTIVHAMLLDINPFDQWGVEFGKQHASALSHVLQGKHSLVMLDPSTTDLIQRIAHKA